MVEKWSSGPSFLVVRVQVHLSSASLNQFVFIAPDLKPSCLSDIDPLIQAGTFSVAFRHDAVAIRDSLKPLYIAVVFWGFTPLDTIL